MVNISISVSFIKKHGYILGYILVGSVSWVCLIGFITDGKFYRFFGKMNYKTTGVFLTENQLVSLVK